MTKELGLSLLAGLASGLLFLSVLAGGGVGALLVYLTPLPLMVVGLCFGLAKAAIGAAVGAFLVAGLSLAAVPAYAVLGAGSALLVVQRALLWRPTADGTIEWYPPGQVLAWLTGVGLALLVIGMLVLDSGDGGIEAVMRHQVTDFVDRLVIEASPEIRDAVIGLWSSLLPAVAMTGWLLVGVLNGVLGQALAQRSGRALRPTPRYRDADLPAWTGVALCLAIGLALLTGTGDAAYMARNAVMGLMGPYVLVGLAVVHRFLGGRSQARLWLTLFYVAFVILFGWAVIAVAGLGLMSFWTRRRR
ncbi:MAG: DUF2232 domain-containing protein [Rhodospirillaceae bacterium]|nr:DUF2232 domain-containing protein [Rhodospirillaceae bacterium]